MHSTSYTLYCVQLETWLSNSRFDNEILPSDFLLYRKDRKSREGGVIIAIKSLLSSSLIPSPEKFEVAMVRVVLNKRVITICTVYIPPNSGDDYIMLHVILP